MVKIDILFILGGDGTVNEMVNGVMKHQLLVLSQVVRLMILQNSLTFILTLNKLVNNLNMLGQYDVIQVNVALNFVGLV